MYKQVPKRTRKMKILSRNFTSVSIAQKVPAHISKQLPPSNNEISNKPFQRLLPVQKKTMTAKVPSDSSFLNGSAPAEQSSAPGPARARQHSSPWPRHGAAKPAPGWENWSNWTSESLPQRRLANQQPHGVIDKI